MANQVAARLAGDDYQHLVGWLHLLELLMPRGVASVTVEDAEAESVDDVTVLHAPGATRPDLFHQVKYHVDLRGTYSTDVLLGRKPGGTSLLEKFYNAWRLLTARTSRPIEIRLLTNWTWDSTDPLGACIRGTDNSLADEFFSATTKSAVGASRERWRQHLDAASAELEAFARVLRFRLGFDCRDELEERAAERMSHLGLKSDVSALLVAVGIVRGLVKQHRSALTRADMEQLLHEHDLYSATAGDVATVVYIATVKQQRFDVPPDFLLDWRAYFDGDSTKRGHRVLDPSTWNAQMLPELLALEQQRNDGAASRLIRARGLARLSAWFALGHTFSDVARYTIEVDQQGARWRTDALPSSLSVLERGREDVAGGDVSAVAVGISVTGLLVDDVRTYLRESKAASAVLFLQPDRTLGRDCFTQAGDVVAFARSTKEHLRSFAKAHGATRLLLFYFGPLSGACFLGHQLNAVAREVQIMEDQQPGYAPSFLLT
ncbi:MAG: SAVED domain-containing protein [Anaerolineaceae bacterium]